MTQYGPERLYEDFRDLGHEVLEVSGSGGEPFAVLPAFEIQVGRFVGRIIDLGLQATPDFPLTVASAIHVRVEPQLYERKDSVKDVRNITDSALGPAWRYWSHNFQWQGERSARRLLSKINGIFFNAS